MANFEWNSFSLIDAPGPCAIIFCRGCSVNCRYCYNIDLLNTTSGISSSEILKNINLIPSTNSQGKIFNTVSWLIISGGEPLEKNNIEKFNEIQNFLWIAKELGLKTGIYTSGFSNIYLKELINNNLLDFVNIDYKYINNNIFLKENNLQENLSTIKDTYLLYLKSKIKYLFINTVICKSFHTKEIILEMKSSIKDIIPDIPIF